MGRIRLLPALLVLMSLLALGSCQKRSKVSEGWLPPDTPARVKEQMERLESFDPVERRNAALQLGGMGERAVPAIPALIRALRDGARLAVGGAGGEPASSSVAEAAMTALASIGIPAVDPLVASLRDSHPTVRGMAAEALGRIQDPRTIEPLIRALERDEDYLVQVAAVAALRKKSDPRAVDALLRARYHGNWRVRSLATTAVEEASRRAGDGALSPQGEEALPVREVSGAHQEGSARTLDERDSARVAPQEETTYIVRPGDTLYSIGRRYGVHWHGLMMYNDMADPSALRAGQELKIPAGRSEP